MVVKRKVSLDSSGSGASQKSSLREGSQAARAAATEVLELFFNTGILFHEVLLPAELPDTVSSFVVVKDGGVAGTSQRAPEAWTVRRAAPGEEPDVEISAVEHLAELSNRWLPIPYQLSCPHAVQIYLSPTGADGGRGVRALLAVDTLERPGAQGKSLDASLDADRPFRALDKQEVAHFLDHPETRDLIRKLEKSGVDRALFKLAALTETLAPLLPRIRLSRIETHTPIPVSLVLDLGNSRSSAVLVEGREKGILAIPLEMRNFSNPLEVSEETFDSRITFLPSAFDKSVFPIAVGESFQVPSIARMGREALDRALETPHRFACTLSGPKRYLWEHRLTDERWHFAQKQDGEYRPVSGRMLKYLPEESGGVYLREDGPSTPADPRYAPRTMMLFAIVEILCQAFSQINSIVYRNYQGKENSPRILKHLVLTYPSAMRAEERQVYNALVQNAVQVACHILNIRPEYRPNWVPPATAAGEKGDTGHFEPFLFVDEALAAQMVYVYQEVSQVFTGSMEEFIQVYGHKKGTIRVASVDIGGGTSDVMIAEYEDKLPGTGTSLQIKKLFQDGINIAGDEVCRAIVEDIVFDQLLSQIPSVAGKDKVVHLFGEGDAGHGAAWRTLKAKLVPYFWLPLARCYWAIAEGFEIPEHSNDKLYSAADVFRIFETPWSPGVLAEADRFLSSQVADFPGLANLFFRFDTREVERTVARVLREPLRRYADILAQFDIDLLVLAGRTSALKCIKELFVSEMPVAAPRIKTMSSYRVGEWYPSKWKNNGYIKDPKSTVTAGATVLHLASKNRLPGFLIDSIHEAPESPIYGLYQETEPHISRANELFREGTTSKAFVYTRGMRVGIRNVDSQEMDGSPLFEVRPANPEVEAALLEDRVSLEFSKGKGGKIEIAKVTSQKGAFAFEKTDFVLALKTVSFDRYWLDTGVFTSSLKYV